VIELGYTLSSEERTPNELVADARRAEQAGFPFALVSDHYHPWTDRQGQSPFVWSVIGGVAATTERLRLGTGVTCPTIRMHPAIVAQAAATAACMMPGRFFLGVGTGESLNEHIIGDRWPEAPIRIAMLEEAIEIMRALWRGDEVSHHGRFFTVEGARVYTLPERPVPIYMAAAGTTSAERAGRLGDGLISTSPDREVVETFQRAGGAGKPTFGQLHVCWARTEEEARKTAREIWPNAAIPGELGQELPLPRHFEQASKRVTEDDVAKTTPCGPDAERHLRAIREYADAGFDKVYVHQIGPEQEGFFRFYEREILPKIG
jgi:G6PDH family F420-dependent oxidoreductase